MNPEQLKQLFEDMNNGKRGTLESYGVENVKQLAKYVLIFNECIEKQSSSPVEETKGIEENELKSMKEIVENHLKTAKNNEKPIDWNVNIVIGNSHVSKSLRPVISIKIPQMHNQSTEEVEFDLDGFNRFRKEIAQAIIDTNK